MNVIMNVDALQSVTIGYSGERSVESVTFDYSSWETAYGAGVLFLHIKRAMDDDLYPVNLTVEGTNATWTVSNTDTAQKGHGEGQLTYLVGNAIKKSAVFGINVIRSLVVGEAPDPYETWLEELEEYAATTVENAGIATQKASEASGYASDAEASAQLASDKATEAGVSATDAADSADEASDFATVASNKANEASGYADLASQKAVEAGNAATQAGNSATEASGYATEADQSADDASVFADNASNSADDAEASATNAEGYAEDSEAWAVGKRDGIDVGSSDPTYQNNSKYYSDLASTTVTEGISDIQAEGATQKNLVIAEGTTQKGLVTSEGTTQIGLVQAKGDEVLDSIPEDYTELVEEVQAVKDDLSALPEDGIVANAKQLISDELIEDQVPYVFKTSAQSKPLGGLEYDTIVGGTVNWNQIAKIENSTTTIYGVTFTANANDGSVTMNGTATSTIYYAVSDANYLTAIGHIYYLSLGTDNPNVILYNNNGGVLLSDKRAGIGKAAANQRFFIRVQSGVTLSNKTVFPNISDLTWVFGSTIADYIYSVEQATAGAGVALAKKWGNIVNDYYPYDPGTLKSVTGLLSHDTVGFNLFDADTKMEAYGAVKQSDGSWYVDSALSLSNKIVWKNECWYQGQVSITYEYKFNSSSAVGVRLLTYYTDGTTTPHYVAGVTEYTKVTFITTSNKVVDRIVFTYGTGSVATWMKNICINFSDPQKNGTYEPYAKHSYPLDSSLTLRGIPKLDSANKLYYDGDTYESDGTVTRKRAVAVLNGTQTISNISERTNTVRVYIPTASFSPTMKPNTSSTNIEIVSVAPVYAPDYIAQNDVIGISENRNATANGIWIGIDKTKLSAYNSNAIKAYLAANPITVEYPVATPTTETADPFQSPQIVDEYGTEEYVLTTTTDGYNVPVGHVSEYTIDLQGKLESLPWDLSMIAPIETGTTASKAYSVGQYFLLNNQFCKAKTAIASGATFTLNTNYETTTIADQLFSALNS